MTLALSMISIDQTIAPITLPRIQRELNMSNISLLWVINAYLLAFAATAAVGGRFGDIFGKTKTLIFGIILFAICTAGNALAVGPAMLIIVRACQGIGAAFFVTATGAIVIDAFKLHERGKAMGHYNSGAMLLMIAGTYIGGLVTHEISWRGAFCLTIPIAIFALIIVLICKPKEQITIEQKIDYPGVLLLIVSLVLIILGFQQSGVWGLASLLTLTLIILGLILLIIFIIVERKEQEPLINFRLLSDKNFFANVVILGLVQFACFGQGMFGAMYLQKVLGFNPTIAGIWSMVTLILIMIFVQVGGRALDKFGARLPIIIGLACMALSYFSQGAVLSLQNIYYLAPGLVIIGIGIGLIMPAAYTDAMNRIKPEARGQAAGVIENIRQISATFALAVCASIVSTIELSKIKSIALNAGATAEQSLILNNLLSKAADIQQKEASLISSDWQSIIEKVKLATCQSYVISFYIAGIAIVIAIIIAMMFLRHGRQTEEN